MKESAAALKAKSLAFVEAASLPIAAVTALQGLRDVGGLRAGGSTLINGAGWRRGPFRRPDRTGTRGDGDRHVRTGERRVSSDRSVPTLSSTTPAKISRAARTVRHDFRRRRQEPFRRLSPRPQARRDLCDDCARAGRFSPVSGASASRDCWARSKKAKFPVGRPRGNATWRFSASSPTRADCGRPSAGRFRSQRAAEAQDGE